MVEVFPTFPEIILSKLCSLVTMQIFLKVKMFLSMVNAALALPILDLLLCATLSVNHILKLDKGLNFSVGVTVTGDDLHQSQCITTQKYVN